MPFDLTIPRVRICLMLPWWLRRWSVCVQCGRLGFDHWFGKIPWRRKWQPTPILLPEKFHGLKSLVGYSPRGLEESDTTQQLTLWLLNISLTAVYHPPSPLDLKLPKPAVSVGFTVLCCHPSDGHGADTQCTLMNKYVNTQRGPLE